MDEGRWEGRRIEGKRRREEREERKGGEEGRRGKEDRGEEKEGGERGGEGGGEGEGREKGEEWLNIHNSTRALLREVLLGLQEFESQSGDEEAQLSQRTVK